MDNVTYNDDDPSWEGLTASLVSDVSHGDLTFYTDGSFEYAPPNAWVGTDTFTYTVSNSFGTSNIATVTIDVGNDAPQAVNDNFWIAHDQMLADTVEPNDSDINADGLTFTLVADVSNGELTLNSDGTFQHTPATGYVGQDTFTYQASDGFDLSNIATVTITVYNTAPEFADVMELNTGELEIAADDLIFETGMLLGQLNATDAEADGLTYSAVSPNTYIEIQADGDVVVTNGAGLTAHFENGGSIIIPVQVSDGLDTDTSDFVLSKSNSWINQSAIYVMDSNGVEYFPETATELLTILQNIRTNGAIVTEMIIKGHGSGDGIEVGDDGEYLTCEGGVVYVDETDVTSLLKDVTDSSSVIKMRGCFSYHLAKRVQAELDGAKCYGAVRCVIGIPGTTWGLGIYQ